MSDAEWAVRPETLGVNNGTPMDMEDWRRFAAAVAERYRGYVRYFQVASEWDAAPGVGWLGTTEEMIEFINTTYDAVKTNAPEAAFVLGGITAIQLDLMVIIEGRADFEMRRATQVFTAEQIRSVPEIAEHIENHIYPVLRDTFYDMADVHLYGPVERDPFRIDSVRDRVGGIPILCAEGGGPSIYYDPDFAPEQHFLEVLERNLLDLADGLEFCLWFRLIGGGNISEANSEVPLMDLEQGPEPGYFAYQLLASALEDMQWIENKSAGTINEYWIHRADGSQLLIAWGEGRVDLPAGFTSAQMLVITDPMTGAYATKKLRKTNSLRLPEYPVVVGV